MSREVLKLETKILCRLKGDDERSIWRNFEKNLLIFLSVCPSF